MTRDDDLVEQVKIDYTRAPLSDADRAMLDYVAKLTKEPASIAASDIEALRGAGFSDRAILDIAQIAAYYAYVNRLADGLGVKLEGYWKTT